MEKLFGAALDAVAYLNDCAGGRGRFYGDLHCNRHAEGERAVLI